MLTLHCNSYRGEVRKQIIECKEADNKAQGDSVKNDSS